MSCGVAIWGIFENSADDLSPPGSFSRDSGTSGKGRLQGPTALLATSLASIQFPCDTLRQSLVFVDLPLPRLQSGISLASVSPLHPATSSVLRSREWNHSMGHELIQANAPSVFSQFYQRCITNISELLFTMAESPSPIGIANVSRFTTPRKSNCVLIVCSFLTNGMQLRPS